MYLFKSNVLFLAPSEEEARKIDPRAKLVKPRYNGRYKANTNIKKTWADSLGLTLDELEVYFKL